MKTPAQIPVAVGLALLVGFAGVRSSAGQDTRRRVLKSPGLVLETGAPTASCNAMLFSADGKQLLAAGDDKVVRLWPLKAAGLDADDVATLRWANWREQRGVIYALALSPDQQNVAVAGHGLITGAVAILNAATGQVVRAASTPGEDNVISALAYCPSGRRLAIGASDGSIWVWDLESPKKDDLRKLGRHSQDPLNRTRLVAFSGEQDLLSVADDGSVLQWSLAGPGGPRRFSFALQHVRSAVLGPDRQWVAAAGTGRADHLGRVQLLSVAGQPRNEISLPQGTFPRHLAVDASQTLMAVAADIAPEDQSPFKPVRSTVRLYDLKTLALRGFQPGGTDPVDAVALAPDGRRLAVAGGNDCEVSLWDLDSQKMVSRIRGPGSSVWQAAFSGDGKQIGLRNQRRADPAGFNDSGSGPWRVFDLGRRAWRENDAFQPLPALEGADGWRLRPDGHDIYLWHVVAPGGREFDLPWDRLHDLRPRCYTFLRPSHGKPARLAVGHHFGISLFTLFADGPRRTRLFVGHSDDVTSVTASPDQRYLLSASKDQTVAAWSLADWPCEDELGASFQLQAGKLLVQGLAAGSPAWEAGLNEGDEILFLAFAGSAVAGGPPAWMERLRRPVPGCEFFFRYRSAGQAEPVENMTHVWQRPAWKFFAAGNGQWVLWRWRDYYYDTSTVGDSYIGWQVISAMDESPEFFPAERFRNLFHRPDKVAELLASAEPVMPQKVLPPQPEPKPRPQPKPAVQPQPAAKPSAVSAEPGTVESCERVEITGLLPPRVELQLLRFDQGEQAAHLVLRARDRVSAPPARLARLALWVNDYRFQTWTDPSDRFERQIDLPLSLLRTGRNLLVAQAYNRAGARDDCNRLVLQVRRPAEHRRLYGLFAGVSDYSGTAQGPQRQVLWDNLLFTAEDAEMMARQFRAIARFAPYEGQDVRLLLERNVKPAVLLAEFRDLARHVGPDDLCVIFLAGHGYARAYPGGRNCYQPRSFAFVCPTFDINRPEATGITASTLSEAMSAIPCRKLVLLDCCHSGSTNVLRELTPDGVGPIMICACGQNESSYDITFLGHGAFTAAVLESLGERFAVADVNRDAKLDAEELFRYVAWRVPRTIQLARYLLGPDASQNPMSIIPLDEKKTVISQRREGDRMTIDR